VEQLLGRGRREAELVDSVVGAVCEDEAGPFFLLAVRRAEVGLAREEGREVVVARELEGGWRAWGGE
jgi:hypothetical protein